MLAIESMQMSSSAMAMEPPATPRLDGAPTGTAFLSAVLNGFDRVERDSNAASHALTSFAVHPDATTHDVILAMEQAKISLQLAAEVRQRVLDAYKELTSMQI